MSEANAAETETLEVLIALGGIDVGSMGPAFRLEAKHL